MAGYHNRLKDDACFERFDDYQNQYINNYNLNLPAHYRTNVNQALPLSQGLQPTFWGPLRGRRTTQESFLQGRGQALADCPDCDVRWLPETLFPEKREAGHKCQRTDLQPLYTRVPSSCNGLRETDVTQYMFLPGAWERGYNGYNAVVQTHMQTRQGNPQLTAVNQDRTAKNYGTYGSGRSFAPYV